LTLPPQQLQQCRRPGLLLLLCVSLDLLALKLDPSHQVQHHLHHLLLSLLLHPRFHLLAACTACVPLACHPSAASTHPAFPGMDTRVRQQQPAADKCCGAPPSDLLLLAVTCPATLLLLLLLLLPWHLLVMLHLRSIPAG
jgi:hypothetical protein